MIFKAAHAPGAEALPALISLAVTQFLNPEPAFHTAVLNAAASIADVWVPLDSQETRAEAALKEWIPSDFSGVASTLLNAISSRRKDDDYGAVEVLANYVSTRNNNTAGGYPVPRRAVQAVLYSCAQNAAMSLPGAVDRAIASQIIHDAMLLDFAV